ncbi:MAG: hypothetical protein ACU826_10145 [Gammaproteobacteria bacterium]
MKRFETKLKTLLYPTTFVFALLLGAAAGGADAAANPAKVNLEEIHGIVNNKSGPVAAGDVQVFDDTGQMVATAKINADASYSAGVPKNCKYPLILKVVTPAPTAGIQLKGYLLEPKTENTDITIFTTKVVEISLQMGGLNQDNVKRATIYAMMSIPGGGGGGGGGHGGHAGH